MTDLPQQLRGRELRLLAFTLLGLLLMMVVGGLLLQELALRYGLPIGRASATFDTVAQRQHLRFVLLLNNLLTFGLAAMAGLYATYRNWWTVAAGLVPASRPSLVTYSVLAFIVGLPVISLTAYLNLQVDLPQWATASEEVGNAMLRGVLTFEATPELLLALLTVGVVPAVSEELMFRGIVQGRLLRAVMSEQAAIWVAAAVFSAIHFEFAGFLPRFILGALLGYAYRWTGSLWMPIIIHLFFNSIQVVVTYVAGEFTPDTQMDAQATSLIVWGSISLVGLVYLFVRNERQLSQSER